MLGEGGIGVPIAATGVIGLMSLNITFALLLMKSWRDKSKDQNEDYDELKGEIKDLKIANFVCEQKNNLLVFAFQRAGYEVPPMYWRIGAPDGPEVHER